MKHNNIRSKIVKKYSETTEKLFMSVEEAEVLSVELAHRIRNHYPNIDCVAGIANGGLMISSIVASELGLPIKVIDIRRRGSLFKQKIFEFKFLAYLLHQVYRISFVRFVLFWVGELFAKPVIRKSPNLSIYKSIAIVDDAVESGRTLVAARDEIAKLSGAKTISAVISWSPPPKSSVVNPDIFIGRRIQHYPWSGNNPKYEKHLQWLKDRGIEYLK